MIIAIRKIIERLKAAKSTIEIAKSPIIIQPLLIRTDEGVFIGIPSLTFSKSPEEELSNSQQFLLLFTLDTGEHKPGSWYQPLSGAAPEFNLDKQIKEIWPSTPKDYDREEYDGMYSMFDSVRQSLLEGVAEEHFARKYNAYISEVMTTVHPLFRPIYEKLNNLIQAPVSAPVDIQPAEQADKENKENAADAAKPTEPKPAEEKRYTPAELAWNPQVNLSTLPEPLFNLYNRIADHVQLLDCNDPSTPRLAYPMYCFNKDRQGTGDVWHEFLLRANGLRKAHLRVSTKNSIYTKCELAKQNNSCSFKYCPYVVAAYIRYLKAYRPEKLASEREKYRKDRFKWDALYMGKPAYELKAPGNITPDAFGVGLKLIDTGRFAIYPIGDQIEITWIEEDTNGGLMEKKHRIGKEQLIKNVGDKWELNDVYGNAVPNDIAYAVLADYSLRTGAVRTQKHERPVQPVKPDWDIDEGIMETVPIPSIKREAHRQTVAPHEISVPTEVARPEKAESGQKDPEPTVANKTTDKVAVTVEEAVPVGKTTVIENPAPVQQAQSEVRPRAEEAVPAEGKPKSTENDRQKKPEPAVNKQGRIPQNSMAYKCLASEDLKEFYGMLVTYDAEKDEPIIAEIFNALEKKGYKKKETMSVRDFARVDLRQYTLYVVDVATAPADMTCFMRFKENTAVLLYGMAISLKGLYDDPFLKSIYGKCTIRGIQRNVSGIYDKLAARLPENIRPENKEQGFRELGTWLKSNSTPVNEDGLQEYLYWLCFTANKWVFADQTEKGGKNQNA